MYILPTLTNADVENGSDVVEVGGVVLTDINCRPGALVAIAGVAYFVMERLSTTELRIEQPYAGDTAEGLPCAIGVFTPEMANRTELAKQLREYSARLALMDSRGHGLFYRTLGATGAADPGPGRIAYVGASWQASTALCIDVLDAGEVDATALIDQWSLGDILLVQSIATGGYVAFALSEAATNEGPNAWRKVVEYSYIGGSGALVDDEDVRLVLWRAGTPGAGFETDAESETDDLAAWDGEDPGFTVFVQNMGGDDEGRAAVRRREGASGNWATVAWYTGPRGPQGYKGWSPQLVAVADGARTVFKLAGYIGGEGGAPTANVGEYVKADGTFTATIGDALDVTGPAGVNWRGDYSGATAYAVNDGVLDNGSSWRALQSTTGNVPPVLPTTANAYWKLVAAKGTDGEGTGDVVGPAAAVANKIATFNGTTGKVIKDSGFGILDQDDMSSDSATDVPTQQSVKAFVLANGVPADLLTTVSLIALQVADNTNVALFLGSSGNRVADSFDALTYVDTAGATNLDTGTAGLLKATVAGSAIAAGTGTATTDASARTTNWTDGTTSHDDNNCTFKAGTSLYVRKQYSPAKRITQAVIRGSNNNGFVQASNPTVTLTLYGKNGTAPASPTDGTVLGSVSFTDTANESAGRTITSSDTSTAWDYVWVNVSIVSSANIDVAECTFYEVTGTNNLTVASTSFTAASAPTSMKALIRVKEADAATAGTDYTLECSRDGGTTWSTMALTELFTSASPTASIRVVEAAATSVSGQPSGTSPRWRFKTLNNKIVELHDVYLYWS